MTMFARSAFRAAAPLRQQIRKYATEQTNPSQGGNKGLVFGAAGLAVAGAGYYFLQTPSGQKVEHKVEEAIQHKAKPALTGGDQGFVSLLLEDIEIINHNTKRFRFKLPEEDQVSGLTACSAILTKFTPEGGKPVVRPYTPISDEDAKGFMDLMVKKYEQGPMSSHMHDMIPGQRLDIKGPLPKYKWEENKHQHIACIAGGTGITPMYQLFRAIFKNPNDKTKVTLVVGNVTQEDILLKNQLEELENTYPQRFRAFYVLDKPPKEWVGQSGYITKDLLKQVLPEPKSENIKVFVCGPNGLMNMICGDKKSPRDQGELVGYLKDLGYSQDQVYKF
ncbi:NADH-cytochrome b5 reductase [Coniochaeta pulveracea]|uniref:NADH-cytochrome b5 reductase n=1 Tax=Coniochaeta pulveracea TaxID=177199 RepID=A0A420Y9J3_9PEZI|nr:NADH-cytochrome b5 reductase [Coniochaeta pulveracea]